MKKAIHIVALPVLTALLAACAAPVPVEQGRIDRIERVTTALVEGTLMEGLRDDFAEVKQLQEEVGKQFEEVEVMGKATEDQKQLMDEVEKLMVELEDEFQEVSQFGGVGKQTDLEAEVKLAAALKKKTDKLKERLKDLSSELSETESVYRELTYTFSNLDAVQFAKENREKYMDALVQAIEYDKVGIKGESLPYEIDKVVHLYTTEEGDEEELHLEKTPPGWDRKAPSDWGPGWERAGVQFKLSNLKEGISKANRTSLERVIQDVTDTNATGVVKGTPVVKVDEPERPVRLLTASIEYSSLSGLPVPFQIRQRRCPDAVGEYTLRAEGRQRDAELYLYEKDGPGRWTSTSVKVPLAIQAEEQVVYPDDANRIRNEERRCTWVKDRTKTVYLAVLLKGETLRGEAYMVAEYHTITAKIVEDTYDVPPDPTIGSMVEQGRLTEKKPACPPEDWGPAYTGFITQVLEGDVGKPQDVCQPKPRT